MNSELEVLRIVSERLESLDLRYMLTGSFAMAFYATPRMTRDLDIVVALQARDVMRVGRAFAVDFYVDEDAARDAVRDGRLFNLMHLGSGIKVDIIVRKDDPYRRLELDRRQRAEFGGLATWVVSREDLILSKLVWGKLSGSELQRRDVAALWHPDLDRAYLRRWARELTVVDELASIEP